MKSRERRNQHEIDESIEQIAYLPPADFEKLPGSEVQGLLREVLTHLRYTEMSAQDLQITKGQLDEARRECIDLFDFAPVGYFNLNGHGDIVRVNITASDMFNIQRNALTDRSFASLIEEEDLGIFNEFLDDLIQTRSRLSAEVRMKRGDGSVFYALLYGLPLYEKATMVFRVSAADVTKHKQTEQALRESEERLRNVFQSMDEGFALCEMLYDKAGVPIDFRYLEVNPAFAIQTGLPVERVVGHTVKELIPSVEQSWIDAYARVVSTGKSEVIDNFVAELKRDFQVHAWRSGPGRFAVVFHNVTELKSKGQKTDHE